MTPAEIQNKKFEKSVGGYKTDDVHIFLGQVAEHVTALETERNDLMEKMEVLAEKIEQYREDEESLRAALIGAQKLGQSVVKDSQRKAETIVNQAVQRAEEIVADAQRNIDKEALALAKMQRDVASFREKIIRMYTEHLEMIRTMPGEDDLVPIESTQISYQPPVQEPMPSPDDDSDMPTQAGQAVDQLLDFAMAEALEGEDVQHAMDDVYDENFPRRISRKGFEHIGQFFGEDKPIERQ